MAKKRIIIQHLLADAPKGRRQKVKFVAPIARPNPEAEHAPAAYGPHGDIFWIDTILVLILIGGTLAVLAWKAKHG